MPLEIIKEPKLCKCGCGTQVYFNDYIQYHNRRNISHKYYGGRKYTINHDVLDTLNEDSEYILGFISGDGSFDGNKLVIGLAYKDKNHLIKINNFFGSNAAIHEYTERHVYTTTRLVLCSSKIVNTNASYNIVTHRVKKDLPINSYALVNSRDFWRGEMDSDGSLGLYKQSGSNNYPRIKLVGNHSLLVQYCEFIYDNLSITTNIYSSSSSIYEVRLNGIEAVKLVKLLYKNANLYLDRKMEIANKIMGLYHNI